MPRVEGIMQPLPNVYGTPGRPIESAKYNSQLDDLIADANAARPITAGGTGGSNAATARTNLGLGNVNNTNDADKPVSGAQATAIAAARDTRIAKAGDRMTGSLSSAVKNHGTLGAVTEAYAFMDGNTHRVTVNGAHTINPTGLAEGDVMQINILFTSGSIAVSGTTQWELGGGEKSNAIADVGVTLAVNKAYRIVFEVVAGVRTGVFQ